MIGIRFSGGCHARPAKKLSDLRPHFVSEIKEFFVTYNNLRGRKFKPKDDASPQEAASSSMRA